MNVQPGGIYSIVTTALWGFNVFTLVDTQIRHADGSLAACFAT